MLLWTCRSLPYSSVHFPSPSSSPLSLAGWEDQTKGCLTYPFQFKNRALLLHQIKFLYSAVKPWKLSNKGKEGKKKKREREKEAFHFSCSVVFCECSSALSDQWRADAGSLKSDVGGQGYGHLKFLSSTLLHLGLDPTLWAPPSFTHPVFWLFSTFAPLCAFLSKLQYSLCYKQTNSPHHSCCFLLQHQLRLPIKILFFLKRGENAGTKVPELHLHKISINPRKSGAF